MKRARSTAYPVLDLAAAYRILRQDLAGLGAVELDRDEIARKIGYNDALGGLAARKIGALVHYGLLVRRGARYGLSALGLRLQNLELHDIEFSSAIRAALEHPSLFRMILDRYKNAGRIPHSLAAELAAFGITEKASADAEEVFRNSALFAGVLDTERVLRVSSRSAIEPSTEALRDGGEESSGTVELPLILAKGKKGSLVLPKPFLADDYIALKQAFLALYKLLPMHLEIESRNSESEPRAKPKAENQKPLLPFQQRKKRQKKYVP